MSFGYAEDGGDDQPGIVIPRLPLEEYLKLMLQGRWEAAGEVPPVFAEDDFERFARRMKRRANRPRRFPDPLQFVRACGFLALPQKVHGCYGEQNDGALIKYSWAGGPRARGLRVYHGLAHCLLLEWFGLTYSEADAWLLTIEMAIPIAYLRAWGPEHVAREQEHVPEWLVYAVYDIVA